MELQWVKPDDYHIRSECGRFSVSRMTVSPFGIWYVAWRRSLVDGRATELGATRVPITAPDAERQNAIREMQQLCEGTK